MQPPFSHRKRRVFFVALVCAALLLSACHGSSKKPAASAPPSSAVPSTDAKGKPQVSLSLALGKLQVQASHGGHPFDSLTAKKVRNLVNAYIATAIARPLFTGRTSVGVTRYFTPSLVPRVGPKGHDRAALTDEKTPRMTTVTKTVKRPLDLVALQDRGRTLMITAQLVLSVRGTTDQGPLAITRVGNFVLEHDTHGIWRITGYDIITRRETNSASTTDKATTTTKGN